MGDMIQAIHASVRYASGSLVWIFFAAEFLPLDKQQKVCYNILYKIKHNILNNILYDKRRDFLLAVNYSTLRNNLKKYCDKATDEDETVIVTRKNEKNIVIMSLEQYSELEKICRHSGYVIKPGAGQPAENACRTEVPADEE